MAGKGGGEQGDQGLWFAFMFLALVFGGMWAFSHFSAYVLIPWKWVRMAELAVTFQWDTLGKLWASNITTYDQRFDYVNDRAGLALRWLALPLGYFAWKAMQTQRMGWSMENHLEVLFERFRWLSLIMDKPVGLTWSKKFPFVSADFKVNYKSVKFPEGVEPLDFFDKHKDNLPEVLKEQLGPLIKTKDRKIVWADKYAEKLALTFYKMIPDKRPKPGAKSWREEAWANCVKTHRYERTFALGMMEAARRFGVISAVEQLDLRLSAAKELEQKKEGAFHLWRAIVSLGGRCVYSEGAGILCHYYFEKGLTDYLVEHPNDVEVAHYLRAQPWIKNASKSFQEVYDIVMNAPDVVALRKSGRLKRS